MINLCLTCMQSHMLAYREKKVRENYALSTAFEFACLQLVRYWRDRGASWDATTPFIQLVTLYLFHFSSESPELS